ncbi:hypothetical protein NC653_013664 [Populus alba x Populus x berolinensis]|uniref:Uncharacterized protein n=1 Tax=Populus alba x Populus x berolinensis TaxID=444605 RepID=A0AAD6W2W7_9ROSI|nr:hypothetical protein NC653_013664 [Populus alba x Populus x berolinensis]
MATFRSKKTKHFLKTNQPYTCRPEMGPNQTKLKLHKNQNFAVSKPKISNKDHVLITLPCVAALPPPTTMKEGATGTTTNATRRSRVVGFKQSFSI